MNNNIQKYDHRKIEAKWNKKWLDVSLNQTDINEAKKPFYNLMMFPYPSAEGLHIGNMYAFTGSDIYGRFKRMQGHDVFEPIGLDGFGMHSENYALKIGRHPMDHAKVTQQNFYTQLHKIGSMYDWSRTLETYDPEYYKWTQWLFVRMFKNGLAYRKNAAVNFCPDCKTVLADEQVIDGKCERCGNYVEKKLLEQWFFNITAYAEKLLENISALKWSEKVKTAQTNWIGKKVGITITYPVVDEQNNKVGDISCFTTRPDTNYGATFVVLSPEHNFITHIIEVTNLKQRDEIIKYIQQAKQKPDNKRAEEGKNKTGIFTGLYCINRLNNFKMPLYISDYILIGFGTGAVVGVPGHDKRDFEFASRFNIPVIRVVTSDNNDGPITHIDEVNEGNGKIVNSGFLNGLDTQKATAKIIYHLEEKGWGKREILFHLRDWLISRQRYWGPPIPMIYCKKCAGEGKSWFSTSDAKEFLENTKFEILNSKQIQNPGIKNKFHNNSEFAVQSAAGWYPVSENQLPIILPRIEDYKPGNDGIAPLAKHREFYETKCPGCDGPAVRETDVSDTFLDSSWYFLKYPSIQHVQASGKNSDESAAPFNPEITKKWLPVDMYTGGAEHSVLHLLYSRFVTMVLHDWGYLDFDEPFREFYAHGLVIKDGAKMSKSKGNVVTPDEYIEMYGSDALRMYLMFMGPFSAGGDFRDTAMEGMSRWTGRVWRLALASVNAGAGKSPNADQQSKLPGARISTALHHLIKKVGDDLEKRRYNTAIASMMEFTNLVADNGNYLPPGDLAKFILILAPFAPYMTEELWQLTHGRKGEYSAADSVHLQSWPSYEAAALVSRTVKIIVQVNGKIRDLVPMSVDDAADRGKIEAVARASDKVRIYLSGRDIRKVVVVVGKLVNFVV